MQLVLMGGVWSIQSAPSSANLGHHALLYTVTSERPSRRMSFDAFA